jgi:hypothetical protein
VISNCYQGKWFNLTFSRETGPVGTRGFPCIFSQKVPESSPAQCKLAIKIDAHKQKEGAYSPLFLVPQSVTLSQGIGP